VDGNHSYAGAKLDFQNCDTFLEVGGFIVDACSETKVANLTGFNSLPQKSNQLIGRMVSSDVVVQQIEIDIIGPEFPKARLQVPAGVRHAECIAIDKNGCCCRIILRAEGTSRGNRRPTPRAIRRAVCGAAGRRAMEARSELQVSL
jgi:hypothetical protein